MDKLPFRQIHLDFHTSEQMPDVGSCFSEANFEKALKLGHISSITLFSKCHHGHSYHPTKVNAMHPTLKTDLLGRQLAVCKKLGVRTQIYISAGFDERKANLFPSFRAERQGKDNTLLGAKWHPLCLNNPDYMEQLEKEAREVLERYLGQFDGLFFDICWPVNCVCPHCVDSMLQKGMDPEKPGDVEHHSAWVYKSYTSRLNRVVAEYDKTLPVIYNIGKLRRDDRTIGEANTLHLELESLPTGGWGYDNFPLSAAYARVWDKEFSGMTGKFHEGWGEFGGYKHPNALIYETALSLALGAKCCVGDQLHPLGQFEEATYRLIGKAYEKVEAVEEWCKDTVGIADVALFSYPGDTADKLPLVGANRMMLEGKYLYNVIDSFCDFTPYKLILFPDCVPFDSKLCEKVKNYLRQGGKILLSGTSGLTEKREFFDDFGLRYQGENSFESSYLIPDYEMKENGIAPYLMNEKSYLIQTDEKASVRFWLQNSYFNRSLRCFCSHRNTPNDPSSREVGGVIAGNVAYIAWDIFREYAKLGPFHCKQAVFDLMDELLGENKTLSTNLQSNGVVTLREQKEQHRMINHLLYGVTKLRGKVEVIEDAPVTCDTTLRIRMEAEPKAVYTVPDKTPLPYTYEKGVLEYTVDRFALHQTVVIERKER